MEDKESCPVKFPDLSGVEVVNLYPENGVSGYQEAVELARGEAEQRFEDNMLVSWYDRDRDFESPPNTTESAGSGKDGYINYGLSHGAKLKIDIDDGKFVFFFAPLDW